METKTPKTNEEWYNYPMSANCHGENHNVVRLKYARELEEENNKLLNFIKSLNATTHKHASYYKSECGRFLQKYDPRTKTNQAG